MRRGIIMTMYAAALLAIFGIAATAQEPAPSPTPAPECSAQIYAGKDLDRKPKILEYPHPKFSTEQIHKYRGSTIVLRGLLCGSGKVTSLKVVRSVADALDEEAIRTARKIKFKPAQKDGKDVSRWTQFEYQITESIILP